MPCTLPYGLYSLSLSPVSPHFSLSLSLPLSSPSLCLSLLLSLPLVSPSLRLSSLPLRLSLSLLLSLLSSLPPSLSVYAVPKEMLYLSDIFALVPGSVSKRARGSTENSEPTEFTLHALKSCPESAGHITKVPFRCPSSETCQIWTQQIHHQMQSKQQWGRGCSWWGFQDTV